MSPDSVKRKLTTILAADVVGYSRLMAADEEATLATLKTYRGLIDDLIGKHHGRLVGTAGDAVLVEFASAVEAVRCAVSIQEDLRVRNAELADDRKMLFRIGINVGDVMVEDDDLFGDGVNVAARLEGIAEPGGICISGSTFDQIKNKISIGFEDMGPQDVKNIPQPVPAFRIVSAAVTVTADGAATGRRPLWRQPAVIAAAALVVIAAGAAAWMLMPRGPRTLASFPAQFTTDDLKAGEIEALMTGMSIQGVSNRTGRPFTVRIGPQGEITVELGGEGSLAGTVFRDSGRWWAEDYRFCMQFPRFFQGRKLCPRIVRDGPKLFATRGDGTPNAWTLQR